MACIFLFMSIAAFNALVTVLSRELPKGRLLGMLVANLLITVTLGIALLKMQSWSRWACIVACAVLLVFVPWEVVRGHDLVSLVRAGLARCSLCG
jgi:O-antigen ligase